MDQATRDQARYFKWMSLSLILAIVIALLFHTFKIVGDKGAIIIGASLLVFPIYFGVKFAKLTYAKRERFPDGN